MKDFIGAIADYTKAIELNPELYRRLIIIGGWRRLTLKISREPSKIILEP
jgi:hypothetical protein